MALELGAHVVDVGGRLLGSSTRAPISIALRDGLGRRLAGLGALAHDAGGALVVDVKRLDHEAVAERADDAPVGLVVEGSCGFSMASMGTHEGSRGGRTGT